MVRMYGERQVLFGIPEVPKIVSSYGFDCDGGPGNDGREAPRLADFRTVPYG